MHIRKLELSGWTTDDRIPVSSYYSWPCGEFQSVVEEHIEAYKKAFHRVTVVITHMPDDL